MDGIVHLDGGWRIEDASNSIEILQHAIPEDLVSIRVVKADGIDTLGYPVYWSRVVGKGEWSHLEPSRHWGKGFLPSQARASAAYEALERLCARVLPGTDFITAAYTEVEPNALDPRHVIQDSPMIKERHVPFNASMPVEWKKGVDLVSGKEVFVAATFVHFPYPAPEGVAFANQGTNGLAAGNSYPEAMLQGLLELIERDATYIFLRNRITASDIVPDSIVGVKAAECIDKIRTRGIDIHIKNLTTDIGITVIGVFLFERNWKNIGFGAHGYGAHLDPRIALDRALTEAIQGRTLCLNTLQSLSLSPEQTKAFIRNSGFFGERFLEVFSPMLKEGRYSENLSKLPNDNNIGIQEGLDACVEKITRVQRHKAVIAVDLMRPEIGLPVVKMIAPGLQDIDHQHYSRSERMLTLPCKMGYRANVVDEATLYTGFIP